MKTVLITGCSSGFGLDIAKHFLEREWQVIATMRTPRDDILPASERLRILPLDITSDQSVREVLETAGPIDVLVNNAGIGLLNALEGTPIEAARDVFDTNTLGPVRMIQAVLPQFRERRAGTVVNVTSSTTMMALPLLSVYSASKAAVNMLSECLAVELAPFNINVKVVLPGSAPGTSFGKTAMGKVQGQGGIHEAYADFAKRFMSQMLDHDKPLTKSSDVAEAVWRAATDPSCPLRLPAGADAIALAN